MTPPPHICGPKNQCTPVLTLADRVDWITSQRRAGVFWNDIASALGISTPSVRRAHSRMPEAMPKEQPSVTSRYSVTGFVRGSKHATTIRAADRAAAEDRFRRAYPGAEGVGAERLRE